MEELAKLSKEQLLQLVATRDTQLATQTKEVTRRGDVIKQLESKVEELKKDYLKLWQERFAAKSERYIDDPDQLRIDFGDSDDAADAADGLADATKEADIIPDHKRRKRTKRDERLPAHLPRKEIVVEVDDAINHCETHGEKTLLPESMWDVLEKLVYVSPQLFVELRKFPKYACPNEPGCGISSPERPTGIVEGDKYDTSVDRASAILERRRPADRQQPVRAANASGWPRAQELAFLRKRVGRRFALKMPIRNGLRGFSTFTKKKMVSGSIRQT